MSRLRLAVLILITFVADDRSSTSNSFAADGQPAQPKSSGAFLGSKAGDARRVVGVKLCWCPPGHFTMGSPRSEPERRPGENQVAVTLTKGFWTGKYEVTQG